MNKTYIPKAGDIVAWSNEQKCTSIAVMINEDEFSVCLNFRGHKDEEDRIWEFDNTPTNRIIRRADKFEMAWLFSELVSQGYEFSAADGKVKVSLDENYEKPEPPKHEFVEKKGEDFNVQCIILSREERFARYIYGLVELYQSTGSFKNMSEISARNNITSIRKDMCYKVGLDKLHNKEWLKTVEGKSFCKNLYEFALRHTSCYPVIPQNQR